MSNLKNLVPCCIKVFKQKPDSEGYYIEPTKNQMIDKLLEQHDKLTKYERAFEILKRKGLRIVEYDADEYSQYLNFTKGIDTDLEPEEAELLEELMKDETSI